SRMAGTIYQRRPNRSMSQPQACALPPPSSRAIQLRLIVAEHDDRDRVKVYAQTCLYVLDAGTGTVGAFRINDDGSLTAITGGGSLPAGRSAQGLAGIGSSKNQALACERRSHSAKPMPPRRALPNGTSERSSTRPPKYRASGSLTTVRGSPTAFR